MKICYLDAFSGISGDMTVGALIDAGADSAALVRALESLGTGASFRIEKTTRLGIAASKFYVDGGDSKHHRHLKDILELIGKAALTDRAKQNSAAVFQRLGEAEAKVHRIALTKVHFHEVGAVDSICDIVGACVAFDLLNVDTIYSSPLNVGSGTVNTEHGILPVPAPATAELLAGKPIYTRGPTVELTTPTGAAIAVTLAAGFGAMPVMTISGTGYGAGDKDFKEHARCAGGEHRRFHSASAGLCDGAIARGRRTGRDSRKCVDEEEPARHADSRHRQAGGSGAARASDVRGNHDAGAPDSFGGTKSEGAAHTRGRHAAW